MDFSVTFLGTGTSQGVPMIGCSCRVCTSTNPKDNRTRTSIYIETPESNFVVDAGPDFRSQCLRENITRVDAVLFTHAHTDHVMGIDDLRRFSDYKRKTTGSGALPFFASAETMERIEQMFSFAFDTSNHFPGYLHPEPHIIEKAFTLGKTEITPLKVIHGSMPVTDYMFTREGKKLLAYLPDCKHVPDHTKKQLHGVEVLVIDALRHREHPTHMSLKEALDFIEEIKPKLSYLTHMCHDLGHEETEKQLPTNVRMAYDGLTLQF